MCILKLSKVLIFEFHYDYIKNNSTLLFAETYSLMYQIKTENVYKNISNNKEMFDFIHYSTNSKCYGNSNKLVVSKMRDETSDVAVDEFVAFLPRLLNLKNAKHLKMS